MRIVNRTGRTIHIPDLDLHITDKNGESEDIPLDSLKRSRGLRSLLINEVTGIEIKDYDPEEHTEKSIMFFRRKKQEQMDEVKQTRPIPRSSFEWSGTSVDTNLSIQEPHEEHAEDTTPVEPPKIEIADKELKMVLRGVFYSEGGYSKVNRHLAEGMHKLGVKVKVDPLKAKNYLKEEDLAGVMRLTKTDLDRFACHVNSVIPARNPYPSAVHKVLYTTIESYSIPDQFLDVFKTYNEIWATSEWSASIIRQFFDERPVHVVRPGVDTDLYTPEGPKFNLGVDARSFVFLAIFGWSYRKGYDVLLRAYLDEFSDSDDVTLLICSRYMGQAQNPFKDKIQDDINKICGEFSGKKLPHIARLSQILPEADMPKLYRAANCFVLPTRGEGICLPPLEASCCGLPLIITNVSGQRDYVSEGNCFSIDMDELVKVRPGQMHTHYWDGQLFPSLRSSLVHGKLRSSMRTVLEDYNEAKRRNRLLMRQIHQSFTWQHTCQQAYGRLRQIFDGDGRR